MRYIWNRFVAFVQGKWMARQRAADETMQRMDDTVERLRMTKNILGEELGGAIREQKKVTNEMNNIATIANATADEMDRKIYELKTGGTYVSEGNRILH